MFVDVGNSVLPILSVHRYLLEYFCPLFMYSSVRISVSGAGEIGGISVSGAGEIGGMWRKATSPEKNLVPKMMSLCGF